jgi:hypothetical protein
MNRATTPQVFIFPATSVLSPKLLTLPADCFMDTLDELLKGPDPVKSDQLTGPILDSTPLLATDVWQEAIDHFDVFAEADANAGFPVEQQQYLSDLTVDRYLYDTLAHEFELLDVWLGKNPGHPEATQVASFLRRREQFGARSWIDQQEKLYLWAQKNERDDIAASILGWRLLCRELADSLLAWSSQKHHDPRGQQIRLWQDSLGFYPQNRLRIWALRFLEDARAPQILAWEAAMNREIFETHPELLTGTR